MNSIKANLKISVLMRANRLWLAILFSCLQFACVSVPTGKEKVELIDQLVSEHEFSKIKNLLENIDTRDSEFEALVIRRRAIRPLIVQFEQYTVRKASQLQQQDQWPQALALLNQSQQKLPDSEVLQQAEENFYQQRSARLDQIREQIDLLEGEKQLDKTPLVEKIVDIHPTGISSRWQSFQHQRKNKALASELMTCGDKALAGQKLDLAEACFSMVRALYPEFQVDQSLAEIAKTRIQQANKAEEIAQLKADQEEKQRQQQISVLRDQYQYLAAAQWLVAAKQTLAELRVLAPGDSEVLKWAQELQTVIQTQVEEGIHRGQALYSHGKLEQALDAWESAAELDPDNPILQGHIARAERFLQKLQRLDNAELTSY